MDERRILGIDPGLNVTGYGVVRLTDPRKPELVEAGVLRGGPASRPLGERLQALRNGLAETIDQLPAGTRPLVLSDTPYMAEANPRVCLNEAPRFLSACSTASRWRSCTRTTNGPKRQF